MKLQETTKKLLMFAGAAALVLLIAVFVGWQVYQLNATVPVDGEAEDQVTLTIPAGTSGEEVARLLEERGLVRSARLTQLFLRLNQRKGRQVQAGNYLLSPAMSLQEMFVLFQHGTFDVLLTIPEGKRLEEMASIVAANLSISPVDFFNAGLPYRGRLFPDTYRVPEGISAEELVTFMRKNFESKAGELAGEFSAQGLSFDEGVTMASIVEREVPSLEDRALVAGILIKRYQNDWPLEADATVQYAWANVNCSLGVTCDWWKNGLTALDLEIDSPYNTRKNRGLPPTAICSPGLSSLQAVAAPQPSEFWYYLSDEEGETYYSETYPEHLRKVNAHLR